MSRFNTRPIFSRYRHRLVTVTLSLLGTLCLALPVSVHADSTAPCNIFSGTNGGLECGANSVATGQASTAVGNSTEATGFNAIALGASADATGDRSMALGVFADATASDSTAVGHAATATRSFSTALGQDADATAFRSTAVGAAAVATASNSTALGQAANATGINATALGVEADATGVNATALGAFADATAVHSTALGVRAEASGESSIALGGNGIDTDNLGARALADYTIAIGPDALANQESTIALGDQAQATGIHSTALGATADALGTSSTAVGRSAKATASSSTALGASAAARGVESMAVGNSAEAVASFSSALGIRARAVAQSSIAVGNSAEAAASSSTALGRSAGAFGVQSTALGANAEARGTGSVALGGDDNIEDPDTDGAQALADFAIAIGADSLADQAQAIALGEQSKAQGARAIAMGAQADATGIASVALGGDGVDSIPDGAQALADYTIAIGPDALADQQSAMALGDQSQATGPRAAAIGFNTTATDDGAVAVGGLSDVTGFRATGVGYNADAAGNSAVAIGRFSQANGVRSTAVGNGAVVEPAGTNATAIGRSATASHIRSTAIGALAQTNSTDNIAIGSTDANYTLAGLSHNGPGLFTVLVDSNGNLFAQNLNSGAGKISAESHTLTSKPDRTTGSASQYTSSQFNDDATSANEIRTDDSNRIDQLFALVEAQQQKIEAQQQSIESQQTQINTLLADRETLTDRINELEAATTEPAPLLNATTINQKSLQRMGFDQNTASVIVDEFDLTQTQALSLRHNATREGWLFSGRFRQAMVDMTDHFVNAIGIENYRQLIGANGETTNVVVEAVLPQTTAASNGIQANDVIVEYAGNAIYSSESLIAASTRGSIDSTVLVRLLRDDQPVELYIPAGPLGIRSGSNSDDPCVWCAGGI